MELLGLLLRLGGLLLLAAVLLALRVWFVVVPQRVKAPVSSYIKPLFHHENATKNKKNRSEIRVMAVLGSGGHTTELLKLMKKLKREIYTPITFVVAETDKTSQAKTELDWKPTQKDSFAIIPRSREVCQCSPARSLRYCS
ncbi:UDP-N-acetylglucosamine transferase subunit ALG14 [Phytophthora citrophthora]|uniref:UDP-N-acetylglucosamine transferase subunit ALG14 n=1 Tax=Phytophthora citrophthora TaxID=4793 RepID=A0AAD9LP89_9STRA|nr:UDP-N-acetylglucosamine transferase subunit ALG14 [Phytophthora citrophthora]